jgi:hypothetical protein
MPRNNFQIERSNERRFSMIKVASYRTICNKDYAVKRVLVRREFKRKIKFLTISAIVDYNRVKFKLRSSY